VYAPPAPTSDHALQQPPTLHLLSTQILRALSDATWNAREASATLPSQKMNVSYFLGREIPLSRFKVPVASIVPEIWLELVLWSSLHGGWIWDGIAILERMLSYRGEEEWGIIDLEALLQHEQGHSSPAWQLFNKKAREASKAEARGLTRRKISSELVVAYVDGVVNLMRLGVGSRGISPEVIVAHIQKLKHFLDRNGHSLGSASWDSVMIRLLESGGIAPERRPELLLNITHLASEFGSEVASANASSETSAGTMEAPYYYEPSTAAIGLLHRTMRSYIEDGDMLGATATLNTLIQRTDHNKQKSLELFFQTLQVTQLRKDEPFTSSLAAIDFPAFDPQIPVPLLAKLLDLATETRSLELGRFLLFSQELDGPLIPSEMYEHRSMAASIVRFGTMAGENDLVLDVMKRLDFWNARQQAQRIPNSLFSALLESQVRLHRWDTVKSMQKHAIDNPRYRVGPGLLASFAAELLRLSGAGDKAAEQRRQEAWDAFSGLVSAWEGIILSHTKSRNELYCILGLLSSVDEHWKECCSHFLTFDMRQRLMLPVQDFNKLLVGILDGYGSSKGRSFVDTWCHTAAGMFEPHRAPGGVPTMPHYRPGKAEEYGKAAADIEIVQASGATLRMQGRVLPNRHTAWALLRKVHEEAEQAKVDGLSRVKREEIRETLRRAADLFHYLGLDYEEIVQHLGSLAEMAELQPPPSGGLTGVPGK
jgi:hypothetical protein